MIKVVLKDKDEQWFTGTSKVSLSRAAENAARQFMEWAKANAIK